MTDADVAAMDYVYDHAAPGDSVVALLWYSPLRESRVGDLVQSGADSYFGSDASCDTADGIADCVADASADYVVVNPQQEAAGRILDGFPAGWLDKSVATLEQQHGYLVVFSQDGAEVLVRPGASGT